MRRIWLLTTLLALVLAGAAVLDAPAVADVVGSDDVLHSVPPPDGGVLGPFEIDGDRVVAIWRFGGVGRVLQAPADGSGGWADVPGQEAVGATALAAAGGVTAVGRAGDTGTSTLVTGPDGTWSATGPVSLGVAGHLARTSAGIVDATTGALVTASPGAGLVALGRDEWVTWDRNDGPIFRHHSDGRTQLVGVVRLCSSLSRLEVRDRWVLSSCEATGTTIFDLEGTFRPLRLPASASGSRVGPGVVAYRDTTDVEVRELGDWAPVRRLADARSLAWSSDSPDLVVADRVGTLRTLHVAPRPDAVGDVAPPVVDPAPLPEWVPGDRTFPLTWTVQDGPADEPQSGPDVVEIGQSDSPGTLPDRVGQTVPALDGGAVELPGTSRLCIWLRATDRRGNRGEWTGPTCTKPDLGGPDSVLAGAPISFDVRGGTPYTDVSFRFLSDDIGSGMDHREASARRASQTAYQGDWSTPAPLDHGTRVDKVRAGYRICFRGRGVDVVGNVGDWTDRVCTSAPYDDRVLSFHGPTSVYRSSTAQGGTARTLSGASWFSVSSATTNNCVVLRVRGTDSAHGGILQGVVGGRVVGIWHNGGVVGQWVNLPPTSGRVCARGTIVVRHQAGTPPVTVDLLGLRRAGDRGYDW